MRIPDGYLHAPLLFRNQPHVVDYLHLLYLVEMKNDLLRYFGLKRFNSSYLKCTIHTISTFLGHLVVDKDLFA